jgi:hypothetical protein
VHILSRAPIVTKQFDVGLDWMGVNRNRLTPAATPLDLSASRVVTWRW